MNNVKIYGDVELHSIIDKKVVEGYLVELSTTDKQIAIYRLKNETFFVAVFYDDEGNQIVDDYTCYFIDAELCEQYRTRRSMLIGMGIGNLSYREYVDRVIYKALKSIILPTEATEVRAVEKVISKFLEEIEKLT